jgi:hypothetical protein
MKLIVDTLDPSPNITYDLVTRGDQFKLVRVPFR